MKKYLYVLVLSFLALGLVACTAKEEPQVPETVVETVVSPPTPEQLTVDKEPITIYGGEFLKVGDKLVTNTDLIKPTDKFNTMETTTLDSYEGWKVINTVPSLDTPTCSIQTTQIEGAAENYKDVAFITISADLPFAQNRFCGANGIDNINVLSDFQTMEFAKQNNFLMEDWNLFARTILVVDENNIIQYIEYAHDVVEPIGVSNAINFLNQNR